MRPDQCCYCYGAALRPTPGRSVALEPYSGPLSLHARLPLTDLAHQPRSTLHHRGVQVRHARARLESERVVGARAVKAAHSAIERRKGELQLKRETDARAVRDAVRASSMVHVPPELAATIERSATARGRSGASVLRNPNSVLRQPATERASRKTADWSALGGSCALDA